MWYYHQRSNGIYYRLSTERSDATSSNILIQNNYFMVFSVWGRIVHISGIHCYVDTTAMQYLKNTWNDHGNTWCYHQRSIVIYYLVSAEISGATSCLGTTISRCCQCNRWQSVHLSGMHTFMLQLSYASKKMIESVSREIVWSRTTHDNDSGHRNQAFTVERRMYWNIHKRCLRRSNPMSICLCCLVVT